MFRPLTADLFWDRIAMEAYYEHILDAIEMPSYILGGHDGVLVAILTLGRVGYLHVVYRELDQEDGYIVTAFITDDNLVGVTILGASHRARATA